MNYIGLNDDEGIRIYYNGAEVATDTTKYEDTFPAGDGRIIIGRRYTGQDWDYASVHVDELIFFSSALTSDEVQAMYKFLESS